MKLDELQSILDAGTFHHATYRNIGTLWEGLWIYIKQDNTFNGFTPLGVFHKDNSDLGAAENLVKHTGISVGHYGAG